MQMISSFPTTDSKPELLEVDLNEQFSSHSIYLQEDNFMDETCTISSFQTTDSKSEPLEVDLNEQFSSHSIYLQGDNFMDETCTISSLQMTDSKSEPLQVDLNEQSSAHSINLKSDNFMDTTGKISPLFPTTGVKHEPLEVDLNEQLSSSGVILEGDNYTDKTRSLLLPVEDIKLEPLADNINEHFPSNYTVLNEEYSTVRSILDYRRLRNVASASELSQKQFLSFKVTEKGLLPSPNMLDCKRITSVVVDPKLSQNSYTKFSNTEKSRLPSRKVLCYKRIENVCNSKPSQSTTIHLYGTPQTQLCLPEVLNIITYTAENDAELAKKQQLVNVNGTVYILDHIDTIEKEINTRKVYDENNKFDNAENKINDCNDKESQTLIIRKKKEITRKKEGKVQDKAPTSNQYQEKVYDRKPTTCTLYLNHDHTYAFHENGISKPCCNEHQHDHNYFMSKKDAKTDSIRKENACSIHVQNTIQAHRRKLEEPKKIIKKQRKKGTNSIRKENTCSIHAQNTLRAYRRKLEEQKNINEKQRKEEILKIMEEKRYPKKEDRNPKKEDVLCSICGKMMRANSMSPHMSAYHPEDSCLCQFCGLLFQNRKEVSHHEKFNHYNDPPECYFCHKTFKSRYVMRVHMNRVHINKWKHTVLCNICGKKISSSLKRHITTHSDEKPFKCSYCDAKFKIKKALIVHIRNRHKDGKVSGCDINSRRRQRPQKCETGVVIVRGFITKHPLVLKDLQNQNDLRSRKVGTQLSSELTVNNSGKTMAHLPSELSVNNIAKTKEHLPSELSDNKSGERKAYEPSELSVNNSGKTKAHLLSELPVNNSGEREAYVPSELSVNNISKTKDSSLSELSVNNNGET